jgi:hypothetical protein
MYAGGMLYFSSGSVRSGLRAGVCPEAVGSKASELRKINMMAVEAVEDLIEWLNW